MEDGTASHSPPAGSEHETSQISMTLTTGQVDQIVRAAVGIGNMSVLLSGLEGIRQTLAREPELLENPRTSRSLLTGLLAIAALPADGTYIRVAELAKALNASPGTAHRYLTTLVLVGLVEQNPTTRLYRLAR